ncbi:MAG: hypothetical protein M3444_21035 [Acidobacteriota bacterium]|nr:hypothetical protein [Acidobacteriota bacterium]
MALKLFSPRSTRQETTRGRTPRLRTDAEAARRLFGFIFRAAARVS